MQIKQMQNIQQISIQNTSRCNLSCTVCPHSLVWNKKQRDMDLSIWYQIVTNLGYHNLSPDIVFNIMGEPFLDKSLNTKLKILYENTESKVSIVTNGITITPAIVKLCDQYNIRIVISILGGSSAKYSEITKQNRGILISKALYYFNQGLDISFTITEFEEDIILYDRLQQRGIPYDIHRPYLVTREQNTITKPKKMCKDILTTPYVNVYGDIFLCCGDWEFKTIIGHVKDGLIETWNGDIMKRIREDMFNNKFPQFCYDSNTFCMYD